MLREDELYKPWPSEGGLKHWIALVELLRQRLIEEREKNAESEKNLTWWKQEVIRLNAELAAAMALLIRHNK